jgi:PPOX class probable F420-dependent enzyme
MTEAEARERFREAAVARLATVSPAGRPHLVPITFAVLDEGTVITAVDHKPKRTTRLARLANIAENPAVALLVDHYSDNWSELWWARVDGRAEVVSLPALPAAAEALAARYPQYRSQPPHGDAILIHADRWSGWRAAA